MTFVTKTSLTIRLECSILPLLAAKYRANHPLLSFMFTFMPLLMSLWTSISLPDIMIEIDWFKFDSKAIWLKRKSITVLRSIKEFFPGAIAEMYSGNTEQK